MILEKQKLSFPCDFQALFEHYDNNGYVQEWRYWVEVADWEGWVLHFLKTEKGIVPFKDGEEDISSQVSVYKDKSVSYKWKDVSYDTETWELYKDWDNYLYYVQERDGNSFWPEVEEINGQKLVKIRKDNWEALDTIWICIEVDGVRITLKDQWKDISWDISSVFRWSCSVYFKRGSSFWDISLSYDLSSGELCMRDGSILIFVEV